MCEKMNDDVEEFKVIKEKENDAKTISIVVTQDDFYDICEFND